jgi:hypothetical protein
MNTKTVKIAGKRHKRKLNDISHDASSLGEQFILSNPNDK